MTESNSSSGVRALKESEHGPPPQSFIPPRDLKLSISQTLMETSDRFPTDHEQNSIPTSDVLQQLSKDEQINYLKKEIGQYVGKIKGYQTLGHLYQEAKHESARYKQKNDQLANTLDSLMNQLVPEKDQPRKIPISTQTSDASPESTEYLQGRVGKRDYGNVTLKDKVEENLDAMSNQSANGTRSWQLIESKPQRTEDNVIALEKLIGVGLGGKSTEKTPGSSSASSPSFVEINSSDLSIGRVSNVEEAEDEMLQRGTMIDSISIQDDLRLLSEHLNSSSMSQESQAMAADLIRIGAKTLKIYKQATVQQALLDEQHSVVTLLQHENQEKSRRISMIEDENRRMKEKLEVLERQRRFDDSIGEPEVHRSMEWVDVERNQMAGNSGSLKEVVTIVSMSEVHLRKEIEKLKSTNYDLEETNTKLKEGFLHSEMTYQHRLEMLEEELGNERRRFEDYQESDLKRQEDFDMMLMSSKKQRDELEMEKEDALQQLHVESRRRMEADERCMLLEEAKSNLESHIRDMERNAPHPAEVMTSCSGPSSSDISLEVLKQQIAIFREDFDIERRDREKAQSTVVQHKILLDQQRRDLDILQSQLKTVKEELRTSRVENSSLRSRFTQTVEQLRSMQRQVRPQQQQQYTHNIPVVMAPWPCWKCTFANPYQRSSCEMCGVPKVRPPHHHPYLTSVQEQSILTPRSGPGEEEERNRNAFIN